MRASLAREYYTAVCLHFVDGQINHRLRFGTPDYQKHIDKSRSLTFFSGGKTFGYIHWQANEYGTQDWRLMVGKTLYGDMQNTRTTYFPGIVPGADVLLHVSGKTKVKRVLSLLDELEADGVELSSLTESWWRHLHNRIATRSDFHQPDYFQHVGGAVEARASGSINVDIQVK